MRWFHNLNIASKLLASFLVLMGFSAAMGLFALEQLSVARASSQEIAHNWLRSVEVLADLKDRAASFRRRQLDHILVATPERMAELEQHQEQSAQVIRALMVRYEQLSISEEERAVYEEFGRMWRDYLREHPQLLNLSRQNQDDAAIELALGTMLEAFEALNGKLGELIAINRKHADTAAARADAAYDSSRVWISAVLAACSVLGVVMSVFLARLISRPLNEAVRVAHQLASGDFTVHVSVETRDETGRLLEALQLMARKLSPVIAEMREGAHSMALTCWR